MYKAVNLSLATYQRLHQLSLQLRKPKSQVVALLVEEYSQTRQPAEVAKLAQFQQGLKTKAQQLELSPGVKITTDDLDRDFASLALPPESADVLD